ncbi:hypothetical protein [Agarilytica rhodophyticola]|uniref:hypothetical protein n=1 Tax=Agarilytica rhodophyticola TaxID=1737490 RepID=UPI000B34193C|nr:hypothetical protein [Agarilytica rhodophyticola]
MKLLTKEHRSLLITVGVIGAGILYIGGRGAGAVARSAAAAGNAVNPTNRHNIFAEGVNSIGDILNDGVDDDDFSLGAWIFDITHPGQ